MCVCMYDVRIYMCVCVCICLCLCLCVCVCVKTFLYNSESNEKSLLVYYSHCNQWGSFSWRHDSQHNDTRPNDVQHCTTIPKRNAPLNGTQR